MPSKRTPAGAEAPADASDAAEAPTDSKTPPTDRPSPNEPPDSRTHATGPSSRRATPPEPPPTPAAKNDRGLNRDGIVGSNATLTATPDAAPAPTPPKITAQNPRPDRPARHSRPDREERPQPNRPHARRHHALRPRHARDRQTQNPRPRPAVHLTQRRRVLTARPNRQKAGLAHQPNSRRPPRTVPRRNRRIDE